MNYDFINLRPMMKLVAEELKEIASSVWGVQPWLSNGYIIKVSL